MGLLLDLVVTRLLPAPLRGGFTGKAAAVDCHEEHEEEQGIWMAALTHTLQIFVYIFLFSAGIGILIALVGEEPVSYTHLAKAGGIAAVFSNRKKDKKSERNGSSRSRNSSSQRRRVARENEELTEEARKNTTCLLYTSWRSLKGCPGCSMAFSPPVPGW